MNFFSVPNCRISVLSKRLIGLVALILGLASVPALFIPSIAGDTSGFSSSLAGMTEIRATYGGFHLGFVIFLVWCRLAVKRYQYALLTIALMMGGSGLARVGGLIVDAMPTTFLYMGLGTEISVALAATWLLTLQANSSAITDDS